MSLVQVVYIGLILFVCVIVFYPTTTIRHVPFQAFIVPITHAPDQEQTHVISCDIKGGSAPYRYTWRSMNGITSFSLPHQPTTRFYKDKEHTEIHDTIVCTVTDYYHNECICSYDITYVAWI